MASAKKDSVRPAFHNMIEECKAGLTDIVVVKSIVGKEKRVICTSKAPFYET